MFHIPAKSNYILITYQGQTHKFPYHPAIDPFLDVVAKGIFYFFEFRPLFITWKQQAAADSQFIAHYREKHFVTVKVDWAAATVEIED